MTGPAWRHLLRPASLVRRKKFCTRARGGSSRRAGHFVWRVKLGDTEVVGGWGLTLLLESRRQQIGAKKKGSSDKYVLGFMNEKDS